VINDTGGSGWLHQPDVKSSVAACEDSDPDDESEYERESPEERDPIP
jgi:hypothetical protein